MIRNWQLAAALAIAISAGGTSSSVLAGGFGGGGGGGHSHSGHNHSSGSKNGGSRVMHSGGNFGGNNLGNAAKAMPKNSGFVPPVIKTGGSSNSGGGFKLPGGSGNNGHQSPNVVKKFSSSNGSNVPSQVVSGLGIKIGSGNGAGAGQFTGSGNGNGGGNGQHHHHHCPPLVFSLPSYNSGSYYPPCPPIYYPQPYPVPVAVPVADPYPIPGPMGSPMPAPTQAPMPAPMPVPTADPALVANNNPLPFAPQTVAGPGAAPAEQPEPAPVSAPANDQPAETQPADPQVTDVVSKPAPLPQVPVGATLTLQGKDLSDKQGQVVLQMGEIALPATIKEWKNDAVVCTLPVVGLTRPSKATLHVLKADGQTASTMIVELVTTLPTSAEAAPETLSSFTGIDANKYEQ